MDEVVDDDLAAALEASRLLHEDEQQNLYWALQQSLLQSQQDDDLLWALEMSATSAITPQQQPQPQPAPTPTPQPPQPQRHQQPHIQSKTRSEPRAPAVSVLGIPSQTIPATPTTQTALEITSGRAQKVSQRPAPRHDDGLAVLPARGNPARQRRQRLQRDADTAAPGAEAGPSSVAPLLPPPARALRVPRQGPPNAPPTTTEHPSWRVPALPPPALWAPVDPSAGAPIIVWMRQEMRLADNPALHAAATTRRPVLPVFILAPDDEEGGWPMIGAACLWQHHALIHLQHGLRSVGSALVLRDGRRQGSVTVNSGAASSGGSLLELLELIQESGATALFYNKCYEPWRRTRDVAICTTLRELGLEVREHVGSVLYEPWDARPDERSSQMGFGSVGFFLNACAHLPDPPPPLPAPTKLHAPSSWPRSAALNDLRLVRWPCRSDGSVIDWGHGIRSFWAAGEAAAQAALESFLSEALHRFDGRQRHRADERNTSLISPFIRFGELSPRQVLHRVHEGTAGARRPPAAFLRKLAWRDLAYWALWRFPTLADEPFRPHYATQPWESDEKLLDAWRRGRTGYPLVDAAMTQLWHVGWMPNYMRHVVAGFLVEFLNFDWRHGERWFAETLVDADTAINAYMWQNGGHSGMDQWNFVMHPVFAAKSCDPEGDYVRRWLPQLAKLPIEFIHCP